MVVEEQAIQEFIRMLRLSPIGSVSTYMEPVGICVYFNNSIQSGGTLSKEGCPVCFHRRVGLYRSVTDLLAPPACVRGDGSSANVIAHMHTHEPALGRSPLLLVFGHKKAT